MFVWCIFWKDMCCEQEVVIDYDDTAIVRYFPIYGLSWISSYSFYLLNTGWWIIYSSSATSAWEYGTIYKFHGSIVRIWCRLHTMLGRISISLSSLKWSSSLGGIFGKLGMTKSSGISDLPLGSGGMALSKTSLSWLTESSQDTRMLWSDGLISCLL